MDTLFFMVFAGVAAGFCLAAVRGYRRVTYAIARARR